MSKYNDTYKYTFRLGGVIETKSFHKLLKFRLRFSTSGITNTYCISPLVPYIKVALS